MWELGYPTTTVDNGTVRSVKFKDGIKSGLRNKELQTNGKPESYFAYNFIGTISYLDDHARVQVYKYALTGMLGHRVIAEFHAEWLIQGKPRRFLVRLQGSLFFPFEFLRNLADVTGTTSNLFCLQSHQVQCKELESILASSQLAILSCVSVRDFFIADWLST